MTTPVAAMISGLWDLSEDSVKQSTLHGAKMIGQITVAMADISLRINLRNLSFSFGEPGLVSRLNMG